MSTDIKTETGRKARSRPVVATPKTRKGMGGGKHVVQKAGGSGKALPRELRARQFKAFMRKEPTTGEDLIERVRTGYSAKLVDYAGAFFDVPEKRVLKVVGVSSSTSHRYKQKVRPLDPAASERLHRVAIITRETIEAMGNEDLAKDWMLRPNLSLGGASPLDLLDTEIGANAVRRVLVSIAEGGVV
jgi:putative toxin-antitoxin system antitoxin component (TIGR02293 family)